MNKNEWLRVTLLIQKLDDAIERLADRTKPLTDEEVEDLGDLLQKTNAYLNDRKRDVA